MTILDYLTLLLYVAGLFVISTFSARRTKNQKEMFSAGRRSPWWASGLSGFMTMFSAGTFVVWGGIAYELGFVAVAINTCYGIAALFVGYFVAGRWNELGVSTPAEFVQLRFGRTGLHFFTWTMLIKRILGVSVSLYALGILLVALFPLPEGHLLRDAGTGNLSLVAAIIGFGAIVVLYTMQGGLWAVLMTDVLQFIVLTVVVFMVALLMLGGIESPAAFVESVPDHFFSPTAGKYGWFFLFGWVTIHFFLIGAEWAFVQRYLAVRSPKEARKSSYLFGVLYLVSPLFWLLPPLLYRGIVDGANKEQAYILAAQSVLPPGVLGLMVAAMFSATASMVSSQLNVFAGVFTHDFYQAIFHPKASERRLVGVGRLFTLLLGIMLITTAIFVPQLGGARKLIVSINSLLVVPLFAPALWGLFTRKIGIREMMIVALTSFGIGLSLRFGIAVNPWIQEGSAIWGIKSFLAGNTENIEVLVGVVLPVLMLIGFERCKRATDARAIYAEEKFRELRSRIPEEDEAAPFDPFPSRMVMVSILVIGLWMALLGFRESVGRTTLLSFAGALLIMAGGIHLFIRRHQR